MGAGLVAGTAVASTPGGTKFACLRVRMAKTRKGTRRRGGRLLRVRLPRGATIRRKQRAEQPEPRALRVVTTSDYVPRRRRRFLIPEYKVNP